MLHIAFAKGRIAKTVMKNLAAAGFNFPTYDDDSRKLIFTDETGMLKVTLVKSPDVVVYVARGGIKGRQNVLEKRMITAASKYPRIARAYFESRHKSVDIIKLNGSVELAPLVGLSDVIVDIVETGTTLKENGLEAYDFFMDLSARLICNKVSYKMKQDELKKLISSIEKKGPSAASICQLRWKHLFPPF